MIPLDQWEKAGAEGAEVKVWLVRSPARLLVRSDLALVSILSDKASYLVHPVAWLCWRYRHDLGRSMNEVQNGKEVWRPLRRLLRRVVEDPEYEAACLSVVRLGGVDGLRDLVPYTAREIRAIDRAWRFERSVNQAAVRFEAVAT